MKRVLRRIAVSCLVLLGILAANPASGLTYVAVPDGLLVDRADVVVRGTVLSRSVGDRTGRVMTTYELEVEKIFKGRDSSSRLLVRVPGGIDLDKGLAVKIFGTPEFSAGDRVLLFLSRKDDDSFRVLHIFQGAFFERGGERGAGDRRAYERSSDDAFEVLRPSADMRAASEGSDLRIRRAAPQPRNADLFESWIEDRLAGVGRPTDYLADYPVGEAPRRKGVVTSLFTYLVDETVILRWTKFDDGGKVKWHRHRDGQEGFSDGGRKQFKKARKAWKRKFSGAPIKLTDGGKTSSTTGFQISDGRNTILFEDFNDFIGEDFECPDGGILAVGGISGTLSVPSWKGLPTFGAREAEIIMNDGIDCFVDGSSKITGQIYAHELGHTLGIGHSCGDSESPKCSKSDFLADALMRATVGDPFGPEIHDDDVLAARQLYDEDFWSAACTNRVPGAKSFCSKCGPCGEGQGNCKTDSDCFGALTCTKDVGAGFGFDPDVNICTEL